MIRKRENEFYSREVGSSAGKLVGHDSGTAVDPVMKLYIFRAPVHETLPVPFILEGRYTGKASESWHYHLRVGYRIFNGNC